MPRGVGLGAFEQRGSLSSNYASHGASLRLAQTSALETQVAVFQSLLHNFALQHADTIQTRPGFRAEFARMCTIMGVDPLAGQNAKGRPEARGRWFTNPRTSRLESDAFYIRVAGRIVDVCRSSRAENGGLISVHDCQEGVQRGRGLGGEIAVSEDDMIAAIKSLDPLGSGYSIILVGEKRMIRSMPKQLDSDQTTALHIIDLLGSVSRQLLQDNLRWQLERAATVLQDLVADGLVWVDSQALEDEFFAPARMEDYHHAR